MVNGRGLMSSISPRRMRIRSLPTLPLLSITRLIRSPADTGTESRSIDAVAPFPAIDPDASVSVESFFSTNHRTLPSRASCRSKSTFAVPSLSAVYVRTTRPGPSIRWLLPGWMANSPFCQLPSPGTSKVLTPTNGRIDADVLSACQTTGPPPGTSNGAVSSSSG